MKLSFFLFKIKVNGPGQYKLINGYAPCLHNVLQGRGLRTRATTVLHTLVKSRHNVMPSPCLHGYLRISWELVFVHRRLPLGYPYIGLRTIFAVEFTHTCLRLSLRGYCAYRNYRKPTNLYKSIETIEHR